ncbi:bifunctional DNA primase/helicase [Pleurocapsa sp. CCALA 161]|uniref:plasmid replication protein, CyRepA1 family n=1 Tax=Pleurocapsa sp. CCALA 161 TaxID=2107688 RepID=UPI000D061FA2|nr:plasmid replication protein, CyRepA1 family [Pleurocapsa sp. CCALA 161]PSB06555.1 bifunctional DNA primase/helicase [Pleurocapsa sp. CCALA 161]
MDYIGEWQASGVDEELTNLNVMGLQGTTPAEYLLYSNSIPRRNDGRISEGFLQRYAHTDAGGWWCSGIDVLNGDEDIWGCFKPDHPLNRDNKVIKYEHPPKTSTGLFALKVPLNLWERIADRADIKINSKAINDRRADLGFWQWLIDHPEVPLCLTEGAKKAGALLSAGYGAVALPGINNGYRTPKDELGKRIGKSHLIPQLAKLATPGREIYLVFDQDVKPKTVKAVNAAMKKIGYLLQKAGCQVKVVTWDSALGKGVDDLIASQGQACFTQAYADALDLESWKAKSWAKLTYPAEIQLNSRYLPELEISPHTKLIGIKSPKGTGKTQALVKVVEQAIAKQQKVLVIGHRIQLVKELCQRFGLNYLTQSDRPDRSSLGYGLCIDSLHSLSQAQFDPDEWHDSLVIIDEVEQVLWHALNSSTCRDRRVEILKCFKTLSQNVLGNQGQMYIADADLSDIALDYLISLSGLDLKPCIVHNTWQNDRTQSWQVYNYQGKTPKKLVNNLEIDIQQGGKPFICLSAQKLTSKWGTQTLEAYLKQQFPQRKILRIDSQSLTDHQHPAYNCISNLEQVLNQYDIVLASPSIETGISIELKHFTSVWAIAQGIQAENAVRQTLARIRHNVPRHLWCANYSYNKIGNGSTSIPALLSSSQRFTQLNIRLLQQSDFTYLDDLDTGFQAESLLCWAKMAVRYNAAAVNYRNSILAGLKAEGHQILDASQYQPEIPTKSTTDNSLVAAITEISSQNYLAECVAISRSPSLDEAQYRHLCKQVIKSLGDRRQLRKYELQQRYHLPITPELVSLDDQGWYQKIRLHYFLTVGRPYLADRDTKAAHKLIKQGHGSLFLPDFNSSQLGAIVGSLEVLGIPVLLQQARELRNTDPDLQSLAAIALSNRHEIKTILNLSLAKNYSPITIISRLLGKIACKIKCLRYETHNHQRIRIYQILAPEDLREQVFTHWLNIDRQRPGNSLFWSSDRHLSNNNNKISAQIADDNYLQLSLDV